MATPAFAIKNRGHHNVLSVQPDGHIQTRPTVGGDWEKFSIISAGPGLVSLRSSHGWYLCAQPDGGIQTRRDVDGDGQRFSIVNNADGTVAFHSPFGKYLSDEGSRLVWNRDAVGDWESFDIVPVRVRC